MYVCMYVSHLLGQVASFIVCYLETSSHWQATDHELSLVAQTMTTAMNVAVYSKFENNIMATVTQGGLNLECVITYTVLLLSSQQLCFKV